MLSEIKTLPEPLQLIDPKTISRKFCFHPFIYFNSNYKNRITTKSKNQQSPNPPLSFITTPIMIQKISNIINFTGWIFLIFHVGIPLFVDPKTFITSDITLDVIVLRAVQTFQIMDILLILIGKSKGSVIGAFFQILGRLIVAWIFIEPQTKKLYFAWVVIIWSLADANRYLYYLFKNHPLTSTLRYNSFILLYPIGIMGEMYVINDYVFRNIEKLQVNHITLIRVIQVGICVFGAGLYIYMLKSRSKFYKNQGGSRSNKTQQVEMETQPSSNSGKSEGRSRSPRAKRD